MLNTHISLYYKPINLYNAWMWIGTAVQLWPCVICYVMHASAKAMHCCDITETWQTYIHTPLTTWACLQCAGFCWWCWCVYCCFRSSFPFCDKWPLEIVLHILWIVCQHFQKVLPLPCYFYYLFKYSFKGQTDFWPGRLPGLIFSIFRLLVFGYTLQVITC